MSFITVIKFIIVIVVVFFLTLSGIIDFMVIFNDTKGSLADIPANKTATWIAKNTPKDAIFLNSSFLYHPASIAGRKIFLGWPYFAWSEGYDTDERLKVMRALYGPTSLTLLCPSLKVNNISYVTFQDRNMASELSLDEEFYKTNFTQVFSDPTEGFRIYLVKSGCP